MTADLEHELARLRAWKQEALPLFDGLQDLGAALGLPLGVLVTGPLAVEAANTLRQQVDAVTALIEPQEAKDGRVPCCQLRDALGLPRRERTPR